MTQHFLLLIEVLQPVVAHIFVVLTVLEATRRPMRMAHIVISSHYAYSGERSLYISYTIRRPEQLELRSFHDTERLVSASRFVSLKLISKQTIWQLFLSFTVGRGRKRLTVSWKTRTYARLIRAPRALFRSRAGGLPRDGSILSLSFGILSNPRYAINCYYSQLAMQGGGRGYWDTRFVFFTADSCPRPSE